jgi:hypothetical protein
MVRGALLMSLLVALGISGYVFTKQSQSAGPQSPAAATAIAEGQQAAAIANLQQAATGLEQSRAASGTYAGADVGGYGGVTLVRADATQYCIQAGVAQAVEHLAGPGGAPAPGPC